MEEPKNYKWTKPVIVELIKLRNCPEWTEKFNLMKGKAKQTGMLWNSLAKELSSELSSSDCRTQYSYLVGQFKHHNLIARRSGEGPLK